MNSVVSNLLPGTPPLVTIVVPAFNEPIETITESLRSIQNQTWTNFECIVVDESTDFLLAQACERICGEDSRFTYIHPEKRLGLPASLNLAIQHATGSLIARFDSDDVCISERIAQQVKFMEDHPDIGVLGGALEIISETNEVLAQRYYPEEHIDIKKVMQLTTAIAHPTVMFRRDLVTKFGGYSESFRFSEDLDLWLRWLNAGVRFANLPYIVLKYRQSATNRNPIHWRYNLKARTANFKCEYFGRRLFGIVSIAVWSILPASLQRVVFKALVLARVR